ncbi:hypothetical protein, partial [Prevotella histicola]|uniref:hypothetical protein n=1 Tax=Prevotella histicola TaxID=470565 RepID=UPI00360F75A3
MKMKSKYIAWAIAPIFLIGCSDYLETPPSVDYGENEVFATRADAEKLLTTLYAEAEIIENLRAAVGEITAHERRARKALSYVGKDSV